MWDHFLWEGYQNKSKEMVIAAHPSWTNDSQIAAQAESDFNAGAKLFFETTIQTMRKIRPKARIGFYGTPTKAYGGWWNASLPCRANIDKTSCAVAIDGDTTGTCHWCTGPLIRNDSKQGFCVPLHSPCPLSSTTPVTPLGISSSNRYFPSCCLLN